MREHGESLHRRRLTGRRPIAVACALAVVVAGGLTAGASAASPLPDAPQSKTFSKLGARLAAVAEPSIARSSASAQSRAAGLPTAGTASLLRDEAGRLIVTVRLADSTPPSDEALTAIGAELTATSPSGTRASIAVPAASLRDLAALSEIAYVREELYPVRRVACPTGVLSEGDAQLNADDARSTFGVDGSGINVGVVSDSFDDLGGAAGDIAGGEIPGAGNPCGNTTPVDVLFDIDDISPGNGIDEGRAMAQIVHDLAPGAEISFATAVGGELQMAQRIIDLAVAGADVTTDDIGYLFEPMFQDGPIGVAITENLDQRDVPHFTAGGNSNVIIGGKDVSSYEAPAYRPAPCPAGIPAGYTDCHDFDPGAGVDTGNGFSLAAFGELTTALGWSEPLDGVTTDLDLFIIDTSDNSVASAGVEFNQVIGVPNELTQVTTGSSSANGIIVIARATGSTGTPRLKHLFYSESGLNSVEWDTSGGGDIVGPTIVGHAAAEDSVIVAAVPFNDSSTPEDFSSRGPGRICWEPVGSASPAAPITPCATTQIDLAATDGAVNSFFGTNVGGGTFRFFGTSAAAPHAAAVAALARSYAPCESAESVLNAMTSSAAAVGAFGVEEVGAGLVDAEAALTALGAVASDPCVSASPTSLTVVAGETSDPITLTVADADNDPADLAIAIASDNQAAVPDSSFAMTGSGNLRTITVTPPVGSTGTATLTIEVRDPDDNTGTTTVTVTVVAEAPAITPQTPARLVDTRSSGETVDGSFEGDGAIAGGDVYTVQIAGRGGVPADATAAVLNLSTVNSAGNGFLTIYDCGLRPLASSINYSATGVVNNEIIAKLSPTGELCIFARTTTDLVVDAVGSATPASPYRPLTPARLVETRTGFGFLTDDGLFEGDGAIPGGLEYEVQIAGRGGIAADATAAVLNLSTVGSVGNGFLTVYDCGPTRPLASSINYTAAGVVNNEIIAKLSATGTICIFARTTTDLVIDAVGEIPDGYTPLVPARLADTRFNGDTVDGQFQREGAITGGTEYEVQVAGRGGVPADAGAAVLNLSTVNSVGNGFLTIYDCGATRPLASSINYTAAGVVNNEIIAKLSATGTICVFARTTTDLVIDAVGSV